MSSVLEPPFECHDDAKSPAQQTVDQHTILLLEKSFGSHLRDHAIRISRERHALRQRMRESGFQSGDSLALRR